MVALKLWGPFLKGRKCQIFCDNYAAVSVINSGRSRNEFLNSCLREIAFLCAIHETELFCVHIEGSSNRPSDCLSRWHLNPQHQVDFFGLMGNHMIQSNVDKDMFLFSAEW